MELGVSRQPFLYNIFIFQPEHGHDIQLHSRYNLPLNMYNQSGNFAQYTYDANGDRIKKVASGATTFYVPGADGKTELVSNDGVLGSARINIWGRDMLGHTARRYYPTVLPFGYCFTVFHRIRVDYNPLTAPTVYRYYYLKDHLGTIRMTVNQSGAISSYDAKFPIILMNENFVPPLYGGNYYPYGLQMANRSSNVGKGMQGINLRVKREIRKPDTTILAREAMMR